jgi:hypothetical protein
MAKPQNQGLRCMPRVYYESRSLYINGRRPTRGNTV